MKTEKDFNLSEKIRKIKKGCGKTLHGGGWDWKCGDKYYVKMNIKMGLCDECREKLIK